jgi:hypothetical protein
VRFVKLAIILAFAQGYVIQSAMLDNVDTDGYLAAVRSVLPG